MSDLTRQRGIDEVCTHFEQRWRAGQRPRIEDLLAENQGSDTEALLKELLLLEIFHRRRLGETPSVEDYRQRFPHLEADWWNGALAEPSASTQTQQRANSMAQGEPSRRV